MFYLRSFGLSEERIFCNFFISLVFVIFAKLNYLCKIKRKIEKKQIYEEEISCI